MSLARLAARALAVAAATVGVALAGSGVAAASPATPAAATVAAVTMKPAQITGFTWVAGQSQFAQPSANRLARTVFQIRPDGTFVMAQPDGYPTVVGRMSAGGAFTGDYRHTVGYTGTTYVHISGQVSIGGGQVRMSLLYEAGSATGAVINGQKFGANASKAYRAQMVMTGA